MKSKLNIPKLVWKLVLIWEYFSHQFSIQHLLKNRSWLKTEAKERNKSLTQSELDYKHASVEEFRENLFLYCGISLSVFKLSVRTQAAFWFMLFNWIECNNYSITIDLKKRKVLAKYYSWSDDPDSRSVHKRLKFEQRNEIKV